MMLNVKTFDELSALEIYEILKSRAEIFLIGQGIHYLDMDDVDKDSLHCFYMENNRVTAYLRAYYADDKKSAVKLGRVLTLKHGKGIGSRLLNESIPAIREKLNVNLICIDAQKTAIDFYRKAGFTITSGEFLEEGIVHVKMELKI